jgi:hypothetical protein
MLHQNGAGYPAFWGGLFRVENAEGLSEIPSKRLIRRALGHEYEVEFEAEAQELRIPLPEKACLECVRNGKSRCRGGEVYRNCGREFPECDDRPCWLFRIPAGSTFCFGMARAQSLLRGLDTIVLGTSLSRWSQRLFAPRQDFMHRSGRPLRLRWTPRRYVLWGGFTYRIHIGSGKCCWAMSTTLHQGIRVWITSGMREGFLRYVVTPVFASYQPEPAQWEVACDKKLRQKQFYG